MSRAFSQHQGCWANAAGSLTRTTVTNGLGAYVIPGLPGGTYNLNVTAKGFQKFTVNHVVLSVAEKQRIDVTMTVGAVTEEVVVTGENVAQVETQTSEIGSTITGKQVNQLILNGRNFTQLVTLTPGVVSQTGQDEGTVGGYGNVAYSMNGGRTEYNNQLYLPRQPDENRGQSHSADGRVLRCGAEESAELALHSGHFEL